VTQVTKQHNQHGQICKKIANMENILQNATIIDVRTPNEYEQAHYPGAVNIPLTEVSHRLDEIKEMKQPIVMYCLSGGRSGLAVSIVKKTGLKDVYNGGGIQDLLRYK